jgi:hypothetical protein
MAEEFVPQMLTASWRALRTAACGDLLLQAPSPEPPEAPALSWPPRLCLPRTPPEPLLACSCAAAGGLTFTPRISCWYKNDNTWLLHYAETKRPARTKLRYYKIIALYMILAVIIQTQWHAHRSRIHCRFCQCAGCPHKWWSSCGNQDNSAKLNWTITTIKTCSEHYIFARLHTRIDDDEIPLLKLIGADKLACRNTGEAIVWQMLENNARKCYVK